jgi:hypothetical protein
VVLKFGDRAGVNESRGHWQSVDCEFANDES